MPSLGEPTLKKNKKKQTKKTSYIKGGAYSGDTITTLAKYSKGKKKFRL
jgi:hypothetical protein